MSSERREKSERHRRLNFTQPAELPPPRWIQPSRHRPSPARRLLGFLLLVGVLMLLALLWPRAFA